MARDIWFISDTHFGHANIIQHAGRPFASVEEMDTALAQNWSDLIKPSDLVYHLGDITWTARGLELFRLLPGTKRLILGNHDSGKECAPLVQKMYLFRRFREHGFVASHMPMRCEDFREPVNVHGHIHQNDAPTPHHINISVEKTDYRPIHIDELLALVRDATGGDDA